MLTVLLNMANPEYRIRKYSLPKPVIEHRHVMYAYPRRVLHSAVCDWIANEMFA